MTGRDLVTASLRLIGVIAPGESLPADEATDALAAINRMLGGWSTEGLLIHANTREQFSLTSDDGSYTMGASGDFSTTRPMEILEAFIRSEAFSPALDYPPLKHLSLSEWSAIHQKEAGTGIPHSFYEDGGYPLRTLYLYPEPSASLYLVIHSKKQLTEIATLDTSLSLPPGYERALVYNGALELSPEYGKVVPDVVAMIAMESKAGVKRMNIQPAYLRCDDALVPSGGLNIYTGGV